MRTFLCPLLCTVLMASACISSGNLRNEREDEDSMTPSNGGERPGMGGGGAGAEPSPPSARETGGTGGTPSAPSGGQGAILDACYATDPPTEFVIQPSPTWGPGTFAVVERDEGTVDVVVLRNGRAFYERFDGRWQESLDLGQPIVATLPVNLVTVTLMKNGPRLDLFAVGEDQQIYHRYTPVESPNTFWAEGGYAYWTNVREIIPGAAEVAVGSSLAATSTEPGNLELFWWTPSGNLAHLHGQGYRWWTPPESGDTLAYLRPLGAAGGRLVATSPGAGQFHLFAGEGGDIAHHWFDGSWNWELLHVADFCTGGELKLTSLFAVSPEPGRIELFGSSALGLRRTIVSRDSSWRDGEGSGSSLLFDQVLVNAEFQQLGALSGLGEKSSLWMNNGVAISRFSALWPQ